MIKLQKTTLLASVLALAFSQSAWATEESGRTTDGNVPVAHSDSQGGNYVSFVSVEAFYGMANDEISDGDLDKLNIGGLSIRRSYEYKKSVITEAVVLPELYIIGSVGGGSLDQTWYGYGVSESMDYSLLTMQIAGGANLRCCVNDRFSVFGGARIGVAYESLEIDYKYRQYGVGEASFSKREGAFGLLYGIGVGAELRISSSGSLTFGIDYVGSTAQPEFDIYGAKAEAEEQSYVMFSVGAKFQF